MPINPGDAPEGFYASTPATEEIVPTCNGCWFYETNHKGTTCGVCVGGERVDMQDVIFLKLDSD